MWLNTLSYINWRWRDWRFLKFFLIFLWRIILWDIREREVVKTVDYWSLRCWRGSETRGSRRSEFRRWHFSQKRIWNEVLADKLEVLRCFWIFESFLKLELETWKLEIFQNLISVWGHQNEMRLKYCSLSHRRGPKVLDSYLTGNL